LRTLQDRPKLLPAHAIRFDKFQSLRRPIPLPATRHPSERQIVTLRASSSAVTQDAAGNIHLALYFAGKHKLVYATAPHPACSARATLQRRRQMGNARRTIIDLAYQNNGGGGPCRVTGVLFFSTRRQQTEVLNMAELSPILAVNSSHTCSRS